MADESSQPIPVEKGWPILGILPKLISGDPYEYLKNIMLERGDFVQLNILNQPVYLISHPEYLKRVLWENYHNYRKPGMFYDSGKAVVGNGLLTSDGDLWLRQRRMIQPHLHRKALVHLFIDMMNAIAEILERWELLAQNGIETELGERMGEITMNVTTHTMFGNNLLSPDEITEMGKHIRGIVKFPAETLYSSALPKWFPIPGQKQFDQDRIIMKKMVSLIIAKCRAEDEKEKAASLIHMLINAVDEESQQQMTEQQLFDEVMTIIIAGYETTATALTWLAIVLEKYPEVLEKLQVEIDQVLGGRAPTFEDVPQLAYTRRVFMEILRMYTILPFLPRALNNADQLGSYSLPANALVLVSYHGVHHNPRVWDNPEVFDPDRFTPERITGRHAFAYVPFSAGPRKCAGDDFALLEGTLAIAMILQKFDIKLTPNQTFSAKMGGAMHPKNGVKATLSLRTSS